MATNHYGHWYLTSLLMPKMKSQNFESRIINVSGVRYLEISKADCNMYDNSGSCSEFKGVGTQITIILHSLTSAKSLDIE